MDDKWQDMARRLAGYLERLKLEFDVNVCECGERWDETDGSVIVNQALTEYNKMKGE